LLTKRRQFLQANDMKEYMNAAIDINYNNHRINDDLIEKIQD